jgi:branched-chain amino acid transport system substrate-binding protein
MKPTDFGRRALMLAPLASLAGGALAQDKAHGEMRWVQLCDMSGAYGESNKDALLASRMAIDDANQRGGVLGRRIELEAVDTQGNAARVPELLAELRQRSDVFGLFSMRSTAELMAAAKSLPGWPIFGSSSGADPLRKVVPPNVIFVRTTWGAEVDKLLVVARNIGLLRVGVVYPDGPLGQAAQALLDPLLKKHGLTVGAVGTIPNPASSDVGPAVEKMIAGNVQIVIVGLAKPAADFAIAARKAGLAAPIYMISDAIVPDFMERMKGHSRGIGLSSPIPSPWDSSVPITRDYQQAMTRRKLTSKDFSFASMEGYVNARMLVEVLRRAGPDPNRERFIETARSLRLGDYGGMVSDFPRSGSLLSYTEVYVISESGRLRR